MLVALTAMWVAQGHVTPERLTSQTFEAVRAYVQPSARDLSFQELDWKTSVFDGLVAGQTSDKPVLLWMYFGDPRGHC